MCSHAFINYAILDYSFINLPDYFTETVRVSANNRNYELNNNVKYYYIELSKFRNQNPNMSIPLNQWLAFLDMERSDLLDMAKKKNKVIKKAVENYEVLTGDEEVKRLAEIKLMSDLEEHSALATARANGEALGLKQGHKLGLEKGEKLGLEKGEKLGLEKGQKLGHREAKKEIVIKLLKRNTQLKDICEISGLTISEIKEIQKQV